MLGDVLTNMDVYIHYAEISMSLFPCPTHLFLCIKDINHLRHQISAASTIQPAAIKAAMETILSRIAAFDPLRWRECYTMPPPATLQSAGPPYSALLCSRIHRRGARDNCSAAVDCMQLDIVSSGLEINPSFSPGSGSGNIVSGGHTLTVVIPCFYEETKAMFC